jgi:hypothetical protein
MAFAIGVELLNMKIRKKTTLREEVDEQIDANPSVSSLKSKTPR